VVFFTITLRNWHVHDGVSEEPASSMRNYQLLGEKFCF